MPARSTGSTVEKVVRDSFTMPRGDYELIDLLKQRCIGLGIARSKSELLRAGLAALNGMPDITLTGVVAAVESVKTGRPLSSKKKKKGKGRRSRRAKGKKK
jgi:hypothetical protein